MPSFSAFDSRGYRTVAPREGYDRWAATYEDTVEDAMDIALLERVGVEWGSVGSAADLGCGTGRTGAWLAGHGVGEIDGVDLSPGLGDHVAAGLGAGLVLAELRVRVVDDGWIALKPKWERFRDHPISFALVWSRPI